MKIKLLLCLSAFLLMATTTLFAADENTEVMDSDAIVTKCESEYTAEMYPDEEERNKLIDQCISERSPAPAE